jgi:cytochrome c oxidase subunit 2
MMNFNIPKQLKCFRATLVALALVVGSFVAVAQEDSTVTTADTTAVSQVDSAAVDTASATVATTEAGAPLKTTASTLAASPVEKAPLELDPQVYKNFFYGVLLVILIAFILTIIGKVLSVYELTTKMNGKYNPLAGNNLQATLMLIALPIFLYGVYWSYMNHGSMAWRAAATEHGKNIDTMFIITTIIITIVLVIIHALLFSFSYAYRMRLNRVAYFYPHNNTIEKIWTIVPAIVLTVLVLFGFFTWRSITNVPEELQKQAIQIEVLGEQFSWSIRYPGRDGEFGKRNYKLTTPNNPYGIDFNEASSFDDLMATDIVIPVGKPVRFHITSKDILHSFFIPDFRVQINAVPGMMTYFQFTPTVTTEEMRIRMNNPEYNFVMLCNKICGSAHYNMQKNVRVVTEEEYKAWLNEQGFYYNEEVAKEFAHQSSDIDASETLALQQSNVLQKNF